MRRLLPRLRLINPSGDIPPVIGGGLAHPVDPAAETPTLALPGVLLNRYRDALWRIAAMPCTGTFDSRCWVHHARTDWCAPCRAQYALDPWIDRPTSSSHADFAPCGEAARPAVTSDDATAGRASHVPKRDEPHE